MAENMCRQIQMADSNVDIDLAAEIGNRRLRIHQELATATRGRVQLVTYITVFTSQEAQHISVVYPGTLSFFSRTHIQVMNKNNHHSQYICDFLFHRENLSRTD
jgi:hypothetical protein